MVLGLLFLDGTVVVDENKGVFVLRVGVPLGPRVAWAEVALFSNGGQSLSVCDSCARGERRGKSRQTDLWIIVWQDIRLRAFLLASKKLVVRYMVVARASTST